MALRIVPSSPSSQGLLRAIESETPNRLAGMSDRKGCSEPLNLRHVHVKHDNVAAGDHRKGCSGPSNLRPRHRRPIRA